MPLLDHFHSPLKGSRPWQALHATWATTIAQQLNALLPKYYVALPLVQVGGRVEIDVATLDQTNGIGNASSSSEGGVATAIWAPPRAALRVPVDFTDQDIYEVKVYYDEGGLSLRAAIELVSPANKDRPSHRRAFAAKCAAYLSQGSSLLVVDIVTERHANMHEELMDLLRLSAPWYSPTDLSAIAYRTIATKEQTQLEAWPEVLTLGAALPRMPLWLEPDLCLPVELETSYQATCATMRVGS